MQKIDNSNDKQENVVSSLELKDWQGSLTTFDGFTDTRPEKEIGNALWAEIKQAICPEKPVLIDDKKQGQYFVPCLLKEAQLVGKTLKKAEQKDEATVGKMRSKNHMTEADMVIIDLDGIPKEELNPDLKKLKNDGVTYLTHTTYSHGSADKPDMRVRVVIPVDRSLNIEEYAFTWHGINQRYFNGKADASGAKLYQQQGTWACHPARQEQAKSFEHKAGVASAEALIAIGKASIAPTPEVAKPKSNNYPPSDANKVADQCNQIRQFRDTKGADQSEPQWVDNIGVVGQCKNGEELVQVWSSGHKGYSESATATKLSHRMKFGPTTCDQFKKTNPEGCIGCTQNVKSPIKLGWPETDEVKPEIQSRFADIEPCSQPINPPELLSKLSKVFLRHLVIAKELADAIALWTLATWCLEYLQIAPLLIFNAPEKACGKTQGLELVSQLSCRPLVASNISTAAVFRSIEYYQPSMFIDEVDTFIRENKEIKGLINAGYKRGTAYAIRMEKEGDKFVPKEFSVWGFKSLAGIALEKHLPEATMSRAIIANMRRKKSTEKIERIRPADTVYFEQIKAEQARFAADYGEIIRVAEPEMPDGLNDRTQDNWEPLFAIAECAGPEWLERAKTAAIKLSATESKVSIGTQLLTDIRQVYADKGVDKITSADLIEALSDDDEMLWGSYNRGNTINARQLGGILSQYGIKSKTVRVNKKPLKGYVLEAFEDAFSRYVAPQVDTPEQ